MADGRLEEDPNDLLVELGQRMMADAEAIDWESIRLTVRALVSRAEFALFATFADASHEDRRLTDTAGAVFALLQLRKVLANEQSGAWFTAEARLRRDGNLDVSYDYENEAAWDIAPSHEAYAEDLLTFPRPPSQVPTWYPAS